MEKIINTKELKCKCGKLMYNVGLRSTSVTCDECVQKLLNTAYKEQDYEEVNNIKQMKGGKKMVEEIQKTEKVKKEKKENKFGPSKYVKCSKCKKECFTRAEVYDARVKKFGSVEAMEKGYVCRVCKGKAKSA